MRRCLNQTVQGGDDDTERVGQPVGRSRWLYGASGRGAEADLLFGDENGCRSGLFAVLFHQG